MMDGRYIKLNEEPIEIENFIDEMKEDEESVFGFTWNEKRYYLEDFVRCHNNHWVSDKFPDYIHGFSHTMPYNPLYIELISDEAVNVYEYKEGEE